jgi:hypothetical protein
MKLYQILYSLDEGARTVIESLEKNVAAKVILDDTVVLFSTTRMLRIFLKGMKSSLYQANFEYWRDRMIGNVANSAIVASVSFEPTASDLYSVGTAAGVSRFGPLAYQLVMQKIKPTNSWLKSDASVSSEAHNVWNKMYQLPDLYERKWLGDFKNMYVRNALRTHAIKNYDPSVHGTTEAEVAVFLGGTGQNPQDVFKSHGNLYAYRLKNDIPDYKLLFEKGDMFFIDLDKYGTSQMEFKDIFERAASRFFGRLYK